MEYCCHIWSKRVYDSVKGEIEVVAVHDAAKRIIDVLDHFIDIIYLSFYGM